MLIAHAGLAKKLLSEGMHGLLDQVTNKTKLIKAINICYMLVDIYIIDIYNLTEYLLIPYLSFSFCRQ